MKKIIFALFITSILCAGYAQDYVPTQEDLDKFYKTKTLVVLEDNPLMEYNIVIRDIIEQEWTLTEYDFITLSEFDEKRLDPGWRLLQG